MDTLGAYNQIYFPQQKIPTSKKDDKFYKQCIDACENMLYQRTGPGNDKMSEIRSNINTYKGLDIVEDLEKMFNPMDIEGISFPSDTKNYPICAPKIDLLVGEEYLRKDTFTVRSMNESAISGKQDQMKSMIMEFAMKQVENQNYSEEDAQKEAQKLGKYLKYSWKDAQELTASRLLSYIYKEQNLKKQFNDGMLLHLVTSREIYRIDEVNGEVIIELCDPREVFPLGYANEFKIEDADQIVQIQYLPIGKVIDEFYEELSDADIKYLEGGVSKKDNGVLNYSFVNPRLYYPVDYEDGTNQLIDLDSLPSGNGFVGPFDDRGNVRVVRVRWRGRKKIGKRTYIDEFGDQQENWVSENYVPNEELGESVKWEWVNEAYEGNKVGGSLYLKYGPRKVQVRHLMNKSKCDLGYIGTDCGISMMGRMRPFQFAYNVYMRRLELLCARFGGPIIELDTSKIPDDWELDKWMYYLHILGYMVVDPWNEGKKGAAQGKLSGNFNTTGKAINPEIGNYIQQNIAMLQYIEGQLGSIAGVTKQREGQVENRETARGVERAVTQSSHITERWFAIHEDTKRRVLQAAIDVAKSIYKGKNVKADFILDDMSRTILDFNGDDIAYTEFDLFLHSSTDDLKIKQTMEGLAQNLIGAGASSSVLINALKSDSIAEMTHILEEGEEEIQERNAQLEEKKNQTMLANTQMQIEDKQKDRDLKKYEIDMQWQIALLQSQTQNPEGELAVKMKSMDDKFQVDMNKLEETKRSNQQKEKDAKELQDRQAQETSRHNRVMETKSTKKTSK